MAQESLETSNHHPSSSEKDKEARLQKIRERYFNPEDVTVIERGLKKLWEYLDSLPLEQLPSTIVFPETSTRPLVHAVKPVLNQFYIDKGLHPPSYQFVVVHSTPEFFEARDALDKEETAWRKIFIDRETKRLVAQAQTLESSWSDYMRLSDAQETIPKTASGIMLRHRTREQLIQRLERIQALIATLPEQAQQQYSAWRELKARLAFLVGSPNKQHRLLVIDDYAYRGKGLIAIDQTLDRIPNAKAVERTYFSFFQYEKPQNIRDESEQDLSSPTAVARLSRELHDHYFFGSTSFDKGLAGFAGFRFRQRHAMTAEEQQEIRKQNERHIGYHMELGDRYVKRSVHAERVAMEDLRFFLAETAKRVIQELEASPKTV